MDPEHEERMYALLERYVAGEGTSEDAEAVRKLVAADGECARILEDLERIRRVAGDRPPERSAADSWNRALAKYGVEAAEPAPAATASRVERRSAPRLDRVKASSVRWPLVAAAAVVLALVGGASWRLMRPAPAPPTQVAWREVTTQAAQRADVQLSDGSRLTLAPRSRLRYADDFGARTREVHLVGAAYFRVAHDATRPFRVHTAGAVSEDLGTAFVVTAYPEDSATSVVVSEGKVGLRSTHVVRGAVRGATSVADAPATLLLAVGDLGRVDRNGTMSTARGVDPERHLAWTTGALVFDATPLAEATQALSRWYGIDVRVAGGAGSPLGRRLLSATFRDESIGQVLDRIALTLGLEVTRSKNGTELRKRTTRQEQR